MQTINKRHFLQTAALPDGDFRLVAGLRCPCCGGELRCDPEPTGDGSFRLICVGCHGDVLVYERRSDIVVFGQRG